MKTNKIIILLLVFILSTTNVYSQSGIPGDSLKTMLVKDWQRAKAYTQEYMDAMPANNYSFKANDSIRSFAQQLLHLANANMFFVSQGTGNTMPTGPDIEKSPTAQTADSVRYYVNRSYDYAINSIKNMDGSTLWKPESFNMGQTFTFTRLSWLLKAFEHQTHHRGQTTIYLRLAGVRPPNEKLF